MALLVLTTAGGQARAGGDEPALEQALAAVRASAFRAHVEFLADDLLEGREAGTRGYDLAARYASAQFALYGLRPGGENGSFLQPVRFQESRLLQADVVVDGPNGRRQRLEPRVDFLRLGDPVRTEAELRAGVVFAGFGVTAPEFGYDDYAGLDVEGKVVAVLANAPAAFPSEPRAHFASSRFKAENAAGHGAVGLLSIRTPDDERRASWSRYLSRYDGRVTRWIRPDGRPEGVAERVQGPVTLSASGAAKLFAGSPVPLDRVFADAQVGALKGFALPATVRVVTRSAHRQYSSPNVVAVLDGSDPQLKSTYVVFSAHLDHEGIGPAVNGDRIYNGAYDNAAGSAVLLETARVLAAAPRRPARSIVFVLVTAEEKGLLGSDYFATHPTVPPDSIVADVNIDMPLFLYPIADVVAFGAQNSTLETAAADAAERVGLELSPDPMPEENLFIRSDQYSFVRHGVPAVYLMPGFRSKDPGVDGEQAMRDFLRSHYHAPSDDASLPMDAASVERFVRANVRLGYGIASLPEPPRWKADNFFGRTFGGSRGAGGAAAR